jgi:tRNA(Ile)-lysidine synthase
MFEHFVAPHLLSGRSPKTPILIACSGGSDSVALLGALRMYAAEYGTPLRLAHVNHGIRGEEALRDRDFCVALAKRFDLPISVLNADVPSIREKEGGSMEEVARRVRYEFFARVMEEYDIPLLATAHHANDQLETILLRLTRGTGTDGLCGIPPVRAMEGGRLVIRPLLRCDKPSLENFCRENGLDFVVDSTNEDISYARNRIRQCVIPQLQQINPSVCDAAVRLSETLRADVSFLTEQTDAFVRESVSLLPLSEDSVQVSVPLARLSELPEACRRRVIVRMMKYAGCPQPEERFVRELVQGKGEALTLPGGIRAEIVHDELRMYRVGSEGVPSECEIPIDPAALPYSVAFGSFSVTFSLESLPEGEKIEPFSENVYKISINIPLKFDKIKGNVMLRCRREGDRILLRGHHRRIKKLFCDLGVPFALRDRLPLLCDSEGIVMIPWVGVRDGLTPEASDKPLYVSIRHISDPEYLSADRADQNTR